MGYDFVAALSAINYQLSTIHQLPFIHNFFFLAK